METRLLIRTFATMMNDLTWHFFEQHRNEDVHRLALRGKVEGVDMPMALQQIAGWQTARKKLPSWAAVDGIIYPPHLNMEQCSSEQTARYKAQLAAFRDNDITLYRHNEINGGNQSFVDLTGGFGVDFSFMSCSFMKRIYVERNSGLCEMARHNFQVLGLEAEVVNGEAEEYLKKMDHADVVFLDPARRDEHGCRTYDIKDCTPNVIDLMPLLLEKADTILLKLSPMLDWQKAVKDIGNHVHEVHIVSVDNECKELVLVIRKGSTEQISLTCMNNDQKFRVVPWGGTKCSMGWNEMFHGVEQSVPWGGTKEKVLLFEPNASIMKAGCFAQVEERFGVRQLSMNSHLFISDHEVRDFPGRQFRVEAVTSMNKQGLKTALQGIERANIAIRNFPMSVEALRKKLKLKDGGDVYIFATTLPDDSHKLFVCRKIG